jgi:hypothetical protein
VIDAAGGYVTPGFIDIHTHFDPTVFWDPLCDPMPQHGVATVLVGNCSLSLAPVRPRGPQGLQELLPPPRRPTSPAPLAPPSFTSTTLGRITVDDPASVEKMGSTGHRIFRIGRILHVNRRGRAGALGRQRRQQPDGRERPW